MPIRASLSGNDIQFSGSMSHGREARTIDFTGTVNGDSMSGKVSLGGKDERNWSARRSKQ